MQANILRRTFVEGLLVLPCGVFLMGCGSNGGENSNAPNAPQGDAPAEPPTVSDSQVVYTSSQNGAHSHTFAIALGDLAAPPSDGVGGETSENGGHTHRVSVSMAALQNVQAGQSVRVTTSSNAGHTHVFTFVKVDGTS